jgi:hypothetical protein
MSDEYFLVRWVEHGWTAHKVVRRYHAHEHVEVWQIDQIDDKQTLNIRRWAFWGEITSPPAELDIGHEYRLITEPVFVALRLTGQVTCVIDEGGLHA